MKKVTFLLIFFFLGCGNAAARNKAVLVFAHPDDEIYMLGTICKLVDADWDVRVIYSTSGRDGTDIRGILESGTLELMEHRESESIAALSILGIAEQNISFLRLDDFSSDDMVLIDTLLPIFSQEEPDLVFSFGPEGGYGHPNHRFLSVAVTHVVDTLNYPSMLLHFAVSTDRNTASFGTFSKTMRPVSNFAVNMRVPVVDVLALINQAISCYVSQYTPSHIMAVMGNIAVKYGYEDFILARLRRDLNYDIVTFDDLPAILN